MQDLEQTIMSGFQPGQDPGQLSFLLWAWMSFIIKAHCTLDYHHKLTAVVSMSEAAHLQLSSGCMPCGIDSTMVCILTWQGSSTSGFWHVCPIHFSCIHMYADLPSLRTTETAILLNLVITSLPTRYRCLQFWNIYYCLIIWGLVTSMKQWKLVC